MVNLVPSDSIFHLTPSPAISTSLRPEYISPLVHFHCLAWGLTIVAEIHGSFHNQSDSSLHPRAFIFSVAPRYGTKLLYHTAALCFSMIITPIHFPMRLISRNYKLLLTPHTYLCHCAYRWFCHNLLFYSSGLGWWRRVILRLPIPMPTMESGI